MQEQQFIVYIILLNNSFIFLSHEIIIQNSNMGQCAYGYHQFYRKIVSHLVCSKPDHVQKSLENH